MLALALVAAASAPESADAQQMQRLSIVTGGTGGVYFVLGGGLAALISRQIPGVQATSEVTAASVDNMKLIGSKRADLALTLADTAYDAVKGQAAFRGSPVPVVTLVPLYNNYNHLVALDGGPVRTLTDLRGKRVSVGAPGSGTEVTALRILEAVGIDPARDVRRERLGVAQSVDALKDRKIDAFFWSGGLPTSAVLDLASSPGVRIRMVPLDPALAGLQKQYGALYFKSVMPKVAYPGMAEDVPTIGVANLLVVHKDFPADLAYRIVKLMFDRKPDLVAVHREAQNITLLNVAARSPLPFHEGAIRYFRERGVAGF
ncbi:MAG: TAXI family TRAP transporter solute-binding subunit [Armatimonadetes bacterium]|nr:TAXI family TRAP transporter solute-binding subunit [Armatimonadota bacterium]